MVAWAWSEIAVNGIEDMPKKKTKLFNYTMDMSKSHVSTFYIIETWKMFVYCISE